MRALLQDPSSVLLCSEILTRHVGCVQLCHRHIHIKLEVSSGKAALLVDGHIWSYTTLYYFIAVANVTLIPALTTISMQGGGG